MWLRLRFHHRKFRVSCDMTKLKATFSGHPIACVSVCVVLAILLTALPRETFGAIGPDGDDVMRLQQIRDFLGGQSWFDMTQYRLGLEGGTVMHWSRIPDAPLIILIKIFGVFMPAAAAESLAITLWPPLSSVFVVIGLCMAARRMGGDKTMVFLSVLILSYVPLHYRFFPGSIDHHNLQLGFLALALGGALDARFRAKSFMLSGAALAISVAIGVEVYIFVGIICAYIAIAWAIKGEEVARSAQAFGVMFAAMICLIFFGTIAPANYLQVYCDALSLVTLSAAIIGGGGLALLTVGLKGRSAAWRWGGLVALGVGCGFVLLTVAPQCLANPLDELPETMRLEWLSRIQEARPLVSELSDGFGSILYLIGPSILATIILIVNITKDQQRFQNSLMLALLLGMLGMTFYQIRFYVFGHLVALVPLAVWIGKNYVQGKAKNKDSVRYILALVLSAPLTYLSIDVLMMPSNEKSGKEEENAVCQSDAALAYYADKPVSLILASPNITPAILTKSRHRAVFGNYHRNIEGGTLALTVFFSEPELAQKLLQENQVTYLHLCTGGAALQLYSARETATFMQALLAGDAPNFLQRVNEPSDEHDAIIYRVIMLPN